MSRPPLEITAAASALITATREAIDAEQALAAIEQHGSQHGGSVIAVLVAALLIEIRGQEFLDTDFDIAALETAERPRRAVSLRSGRVL